MMDLTVTRRRTAVGAVSTGARQTPFPFDPPDSCHARLARSYKGVRLGTQQPWP